MTLKDLITTAAAQEARKHEEAREAEKSRVYNEYNTLVAKMHALFGKHSVSGQIRDRINEGGFTINSARTHMEMWLNKWPAEGCNSPIVINDGHDDDLLSGYFEINERTTIESAEKRGILKSCAIHEAFKLHLNDEREKFEDMYIKFSRLSFTKCQDKFKVHVSILIPNQESKG